MKKIISLFALLLALVVMPQVTHADDQFNTDPGDMPTVMVTNATKNGTCLSQPGTGCWKTSVTADPGDVIAVQVYFHNSTPYKAESTTLSMQPKTTGLLNSVTFTGGVASTSIDRAMGTATLTINGAPQTVTFIAGSERMYKNGSSAAYSVSKPDDLFTSSGLNIGTVSPGWSTQGTIVAQYQVSSNTIVTPPTIYQCNDHIDNDNDGYTDYPNDPGCSSYTDNDEYNTVIVQPSQCYVNSFTADASSITSGQTTYLRWSTTGANSVSISPNYYSQPSSGSVSVAPYQTTTYTLTASCSNGGTQSASTTIYVTNNTVVQTGEAPQAITTTATILSTSQARLNGIAVPNSSVTTYAWFQWGPTQNLEYNSSKQTITSSGSTYFNDVAGGLIPGHTYYYRAAAQNQYGTSYGSIVPFQTQGAVASTTTVIKYVPQTVSTAIVAKSAPSLLELTVDSSYDHMCVGGTIDYHVTFRNISTSQTLQNTVLRITLPPEIDYVASTQGTYNPLDKSLTIVLGNVPPQATGSVDVHGTINNTAVVGKIAVTTATVVYTNTVTHAQEDAIAYSIVTITNECPNLLGASVFGFSFLPHTLLGWLALILVILALIVLARQIGKKKPQPTA